MAYFKRIITNYLHFFSLQTTQNGSLGIYDLQYDIYAKCKNTKDAPSQQ